MNTTVIKMDIHNMDMDKLKYAADVIRNGGLVAFPTETVYGLGANALDENSVKRIFEAKGRPSDNPLIVHISDMKTLEELVRKIPDEVHKLRDLFWPGALTVVMEKSAKVPAIITAGLDTVAVRMPSHPVALALIALSGVPIAAPSANTSGKPSPTSAKHVIDDLMGRVDVIIDAGSSNIGVESTVLDLTVVPPMVLRPGGITIEQLKQELGEVSTDPAIISKSTPSNIPKSPGMKYTHYAPKANVVIVKGNIDSIVDKIASLLKDYAEKGMEVGILATDQTKALFECRHIISMGDRENPCSIAAGLFEALRQFDSTNVDVILAEAVDDTGIGLAVMNRMSKAAGHNIVEA